MQSTFKKDVFAKIFLAGGLVTEFPHSLISFLTSIFTISIILLITYYWKCTTKLTVKDEEEFCGFPCFTFSTFSILLKIFHHLTESSFFKWWWSLSTWIKFFVLWYKCRNIFTAEKVNIACKAFLLPMMLTFNYCKLQRIIWFPAF